MLLIAPVAQGEGGGEQLHDLNRLLSFYSFKDCCSLDLQSRLFHPRLREG